MDKQSTVVFRNVGQLYFPETRVECHYSLTCDQQWSSRDWIGIIKVGWSSVKEYYTYTWALVPEGYAEGAAVNCCVLFPAFYLPRPSTVEYQFVYVDRTGKVCAHSRPFTFCAPKPLEELETVNEERDEEDGEEELLLVIPRAQLLQTRLEESLKQQVDLQQALDTAEKENQDEKEKNKKTKMEWECEREAMREEIVKLRENLRHKCGMLNTIEGKHNDVKYNEENLNSELSKLMAENAESQQRIKDLEDDIKVLTDKEEGEDNELGRLKERLKKTSGQMKHDEEKRKFLQVENEAALVNMRELQERLEAGDRLAESLRRELRELGTRQGLAHTDLHQARLQVAQLTLQLSEENLMLREERANWALEREAHKHAAEADKKKRQELSCEVQRQEVWLREERMEREKLELELGRERDRRVLLSDAKRELQELKASWRKTQKEKEELEEQLQHQLELRSGLAPETKSSADFLIKSVSPGSPAEEDEAASLISVGPSVSTHMERPEIDTETHTQNMEDTSAADTQEEERQHCGPQAGERKHLILSELVNPVLSELADCLMW